MLNNVYVVKRRFKSLGQLFMEGTIFKEEEYISGEKVRRPRCKVYDGQVVFIRATDVEKEAKAARLQESLGLPGLKEDILAAIAGLDAEPEVVVLAEEPIVNLEKPTATVQTKVAPKSTPAATARRTVTPVQPKNK